MKNKVSFLFAALLFFAACNHQQNETAKFYSHNLIDFLNDNLNEAVIHDGFSPPVAGRIYAYANLAAYEAYHYNKPGKLKLAGILNEFDPQYNYPSDKQFDRDFAMFTAFYKTAYVLVYRDFVIDSFIVSQKGFFEKNLKKDVYANSEALGEAVANEIIRYSKTDKYYETRSYPLYQLSGKPGTWEPTPPMYGTAIEPYWGQIRPFLVPNIDSFKLPEHIPFDTTKGSEFYELNETVYHAAMDAGEEGKNIAMHWDGDPMPPYRRVRRVVLTKRQLNPIGHWLAIGKTLNHLNEKTESEAVETYMRVSFATADALIVCWKNKFEINLIRPHTYINRYIDKRWDPILATPLFPEYPSGHSCIAGSASGVLIDIFDDPTPFVDSMQIEFGFPARNFSSIAEAADECAQSRVYGGVHFAPAVKEGVEIGKKVAALQNVFSLAENRTQEQRHRY